MIQQALAAHWGHPLDLAFSDLCPPPALASLTLSQALPVEEALRLCIRAVYDVRRDHDTLQRNVMQQGVAKGFDHCRAHYPLRREFATLSVLLKKDARSLRAPLEGRGLKCNSAEKSWTHNA